MVLRNLSWRGRTFEVAVGSRATTVTLQSGAPLPVSTPSGMHTISVGHTLSVDRPAGPHADRRRRALPERYGLSAQPGAPALAAVDSTAATD